MKIKCELFEICGAEKEDECFGLFTDDTEPEYLCYVPQNTNKSIKHLIDIMLAIFICLLLLYLLGGYWY